METEEQRAARRAMSAWVTKQINEVSAPNGMETLAIRIEVLEALQELDQRITELNQSLQDEFRVLPGHELVKFYMKGGNAFECVRDPTGAAALQNGGGTSDWDTQVLIDPWAPAPLQALIYGRLEDLVTDSMVRAGVRIAQVASDFDQQTIARWTAQRANLDGANYSAYALTYDDPQTLRRVFDQQRLGLWTNDRRPVSQPGIQHSERIPGILLNDAIPPFVLYRLGYTWHAELQPQPPVQPNVGTIAKPVLMELIDVTLPRRNTIEAVAVWEELQQQQITVARQLVGVNQPSPYGYYLPLPDILYHLREIATMLCEIADGSSHHKDKLPKRLKRFKLIWDGSNQQQQATIKHTLSAMAGVADIDANPPAPVASVMDAINQYGGADTAAFLGLDAAYVLARNLMNRIAGAAAAHQGDFTQNGHVSLGKLREFDDARNQLRTRIDALLQGELAVNVREAAFSDDLVLMRLLEQGEYLSPQRVGFSGVLKAAVLRVDNQLQVDVLCNQFRARLDPRFAAPPVQGMTTSVRFRNYSVPRATGMTYEMTMVVFVEGMAREFLTVTTATPGEAPFRRDAVQPTVKFADLPEIALQRKVAAALIENYLVRDAISRQYEAMKLQLPVI